MPFSVALNTSYTCLKAITVVKNIEVGYTTPAFIRRCNRKCFHNLGSALETETSINSTIRSKSAPCTTIHVTPFASSFDPFVFEFAH